MTIALDLDYVAPSSIDAAVAALADDVEGTVVLAGGTDLVPWLLEGAVAPARLVDLKRIPGLGEIDLDGSALRVGCLVTFADLLASPSVHQQLPVLAEMAALVASGGIRNRATLVGNLCSAVPSGDAAPVLLALDADLHVTGPSGARSVPVDAWFAGPRRTTLGATEIVTGVRIPLPPAGSGAAFARLSRYRGEDLAQASVAVLVAPGAQVRVAFGAVAPSPVRARRIEQLLVDRGPGPGGAFAADVVEGAVALVSEEIAPITDLRATDHYRLRMCEVMLRRALAAATARAVGGGPDHHTPLL
jgi:CO/xanthine dehydrogenase FAD-binding subunit